MSWPLWSSVSALRKAYRAFIQLRACEKNTTDLAVVSMGTPVSASHKNWLVVIEKLWRSPRINGSCGCGPLSSIMGSRVDRFLQIANILDR